MNRLPGLRLFYVRGLYGINLTKLFSTGLEYENVIIIKKNSVVFTEVGFKEGKMYLDFIFISEI